VLCVTGRDKWVEELCQRGGRYATMCVVWVEQLGTLTLGTLTDASARQTHRQPAALDGDLDRGGRLGRGSDAARTQGPAALQHGLGSQQAAVGCNTRSTPRCCPLQGRTAQAGSHFCPAV
jgi:hypothetical protein